MTYTGRLVDDLGDPLTGSVDLELRIFDAQTSGTQLYSEEHLGVPLDATGGFSVQLGLGTSPSGSFDASLFSDADRWLEVELVPDVLSPRQIIASVPWALVAEHVAPWDPNTTPRFEDCGDGTVADHKTGLQWEKKTGTWSGGVFCDSTPCPDPHDLNNRYEWSDAGTQPDGVAFTDFLARLNGDPSVVAATSGEVYGDPAADPATCLAHHCDWRLPSMGEFRTILIGPNAAPGQAATCSAAPCIDPDLAAVDGPMVSSYYWSAATDAAVAGNAWGIYFSDGSLSASYKAFGNFVRAVRAGSCD
jgi:hypothetical protein